VANMSDKSELKAELERKKQRLAQIREEKKRKEEERKKKETDQKKEATDQKKEAVAPVQEESDLEKKRREAEALLQSMGLTAESPIAFLSARLQNLIWLLLTYHVREIQAGAKLSLNRQFFDEQN
ncbi:DYNC1I2, partial [Cervus elaphus hippelaphus]